MYWPVPSSNIQTNNMTTKTENALNFCLTGNSENVDKLTAFLTSELINPKSINLKTDFWCIGSAFKWGKMRAVIIGQIFKGTKYDAKNKLFCFLKINYYQVRVLHIFCIWGSFPDFFAFLKSSQKCIDKNQVCATYNK